MGRGASRKQLYSKQKTLLLFMIRERRLVPVDAVSKFCKDKMHMSGFEIEQMYFLDQKLVVEGFYKKWPGSEEIVTVNNILRMFKFMMTKKNLDRTACLLGNTVKNREELDNPMYKDDVYFSSLSADFYVFTIVHSTPNNLKKSEGMRSLTPMNCRGSRSLARVHV